MIQLWHGAGALKKFGYATTDDVPAYYKGNIYRNYTLITVSGEKAVEPFASSMQAEDGVCRAIGVSRTDNYFDSAYIASMKARVYAAHPEIAGKKVILYAPTFRGTADEAGEDETEVIAKRLRAELSDEWHLMVSAHPHARGKGAHAKKPGGTGGASIRDVVSAGGSPEFCTEELMLVADVLITDYSSIIFDYLFLKRPVILYAPDHEEYGRLRGFYTPYEALPGRIVTDPARLSAAVAEAYERFDATRIEEYIGEYLEACDGHATERILGYISGR